MKSAFGLLPLDMIDPSGKSVADEWYIRATVLVAIAEENREPFGWL